MARRFALVTVDYQDYATDLIGVSKDAKLDESNPTWNFGISTSLTILREGSDDEYIILEVVMPTEDDIIGFDLIEKVELLIYCSGVRADMTGTMTVAVVELPNEIWDEGTQNGAVGECSWDDAQSAVPWKNGGGAIKSSFGSIDDSETVIDTVVIEAFASFTAGFRTFDLTPLLQMGDKKTCVFFCLAAGNVNNYVNTNSRENASNKPILRVTYRDYPPEGFEGDENLSIEPNPDNPFMPKLTWGAVKAIDFSQYKLYRSTSPITAIDGFKSAITAVSTGSDYFEIDGDHVDAFPVGSTFKVTGSTGNDGRWTVSAVSIVSGDTRIEVVEDVTDATVDGDIHHGIYTTTDSAIVEFLEDFTPTTGTRYYYRLIAEDQDNHEDDALKSSTVFWDVPDVTTRSLSPSGAQNVGTEVTLTVTSDKPIKRVNVDWKDGSQAWYEFETVNTTQTIKHRYAKHSGGSPWNPVLVVEDDLGFWSFSFLTSNSITLSDTTPEAKLTVNVKSALEGDNVTLNAALSQPKASNATITKYEFKRYAADSWQDNGTDPIFTFSTSGFGTGTITASLRITTSTSLQDTDTTTYVLETATPTEITPGVTGGLSIYTAIHELPHILTSDRSVGVPIGSAGVEHGFRLARRAERLTVHATTEYPYMEADIGLIRNAWINETYLRLTVKSEMETKDVQYDFIVDGDISLGHTTDNKINWSFPIRVITRTEVAKPKVSGSITAFSNPGGGKVQATSNGHGLKNGENVLITGTINYNGTYTVTNVTTNTFRFTATWVADDAMGLWRKVGVS